MSRRKHKTVRLWTRAPCPECHGTGFCPAWYIDEWGHVVKNYTYETCLRCKGTGSINKVKESKP